MPPRPRAIIERSGDLSRGDPIEQHLRSDEVEIIAGIDEAGRGPLAGPVVAACVVLSEDNVPYRDSKRLSAAMRDELFDEVRRTAVAWSIGWASPPRIDEINILNATLGAMAEALGRVIRLLHAPPDLLLVDGTATLPLTLPIPQHALVKGDDRSASIAAASIVAKVIRDRIMTRLDQHHPGYDLGRHKGYGTRAHREALSRLGPSPAHRRSFAGVVQEPRLL